MESTDQENRGVNAVETKKKPSRRVHSGVPALGSQ